MSTPAYMQNNFNKIFGPSYSISMLALMPNHGFNRTDAEREKISKYGQ